MKGVLLHPVALESRFLGYISILFLSVAYSLIGSRQKVLLVELLLSAVLFE